MPLLKQDAEWDYYANRYSKTEQRNNINNVTNVYTHRPENLSETRPVTRKRQNSQRKLNWKGVVIVSIIVCIHLFCIAPYFIKNVTKPILLGLKSNQEIKVSNYNYLLKPTTAYIYNSDFMGINMLIKTAKKPNMTQLITTKELTTLKTQLKNQMSGYNRLEPAVFVFDVSNGNYVDINADTPYSAASVIKIPVLISMFKTIESGKFSLQDTMKLEEHYRSSGSGGLQYRMQNQDLTLDKLARLMITESDNTATNMIMSQIGSMSAVNDDVKSWGLKNTHIETWLPDLGGTNYTSPKDLATMLYNLDNDDFLSMDSRAYIFDYMGHVKNNRLLAAGLPAGASIAHKTGDIGSMLGDAGIVYTPNGRKYIVAIMVKRPHNDYSAKELIVKASETIYNYMASY